MAPTPFCFVCQKQQSANGDQLLCCGNCRLYWYCSKECQKSAWKLHKPDCKILADKSSFTSTTGPDFLHYIKFSKPHAKDIDLIGPFHPIEDAAVSIRERLERENSQDGLKIFDFLFNTTGMSSVIAQTAALAEGNHLRVTFTNESNPEVTKALQSRKPGASVDTYNVMTMRPNFAAFNNPKSHDHVLVDEQDIYKTFLSKDEANQTAKDLLQEWKKESGEGAKVDSNTHDEDMLAGAVLPQKGIPRCLQVNHDATARPDVSN
ncbi:hypothetical protein BU24DRAFT_490346 [Aaosphaeria arxii CBS 175.79]|uniref:MYND-type domain-containing protein n=1 Tax=Aaosphaeria arxii CBS 175.79 TaxID=1450172 RepID=A0A6A5XWV2_9PLEO|nr:uncharacterized protein BU24DRAFT_490346 [Aaosphaeria arxii CBS 175.79]KAF2017120.1 hypothetical protein BU24DRAFT_490346 [Aaosphaeria arxii CBS 175.79]